MSDVKQNDTLVYSARTDVGMRRSNNQDSYIVIPAATPEECRRRGRLFMVADGMGAHAGGEVASRMAVDLVSKHYLENTTDSIPDALRAAILYAHEMIKGRGDADQALNGMGTTCDALAITENKAYIGHVGDSRVYRLRDHVLEQVSFDHSLVWEIKYDPNSRFGHDLQHVPKNVITRSLGPSDNLEVALEGPFELKPGDVYMMCSDGLSGQLLDSEIAQILELFPPDQATESLVNLAILRGGPDNITTIVVRVKDVPQVEEEQPAPKPKKERAPMSASALMTLVAGLVFAALFVVALLVGGTDSNAKILCGASAVVAVGSIAAFFVLIRKTTSRADEIVEEKKLGNAPYVRASAAIEPAFEECVRAYCNDLCEYMRANPEAYKPDWDGANGSLGVNGALKQAEQAIADRKFALALRAHVSVINYFMREVRKYADRA